MYSFGSMFGSTLCNAIAATALGTGTDYIRAFLVGVAFCAIGVVAAFAGFRFSSAELSAES